MLANGDIGDCDAAAGGDGALVLSRRCWCLPGLQTNEHLGCRLTSGPRHVEARLVIIGVSWWIVRSIVVHCKRACLVCGGLFLPEVGIRHLQQHFHRPALLQTDTYQAWTLDTTTAVTTTSHHVSRRQR